MAIRPLKITSQYEFRHRITIDTGEGKELEVDVVIDIKFHNGGLEGVDISFWPRSVHSKPEILEIFKKLKEIIPHVLPEAQFRQLEPLIFDLCHTDFVSLTSISIPKHPDNEAVQFLGSPVPLLEKIEAEMKKEFSNAQTQQKI